MTDNDKAREIVCVEACKGWNLAELERGVVPVNMLEEANAAIESQRRTIEEKDREIERLRMQLVACGVVAMSNTPETAIEARKMHEDYMSESCRDVIRAVDREIELRDQLHTSRGNSALNSRRAIDAEKKIEQLQARVKEWQPIETAPEEGDFLVFIPGKECSIPQVQTAKYRKNYKVIGHAFAFDLNNPTHWMPLPEPPITPPGEKK